MTPEPLRFADLHAHYPMRVLGEARLNARQAVRGAWLQPTVAGRIKALILTLASMLFSHKSPFSGYRITPEKLLSGNVALAMSVVTRTDDELDLGEHFMSPPKPRYFHGLLKDLKAVEEEVSTHDPEYLRLLTGPKDLKEWLGEPQLVTGLAHAVEGGFSLGGEASEVEKNVATLAEKGVVYVTLAHLLYRHVAANTPALPFLPDTVYDKLFPQPPSSGNPDLPTGLTELGRAAVRAMAKHRVMVDISHMREDAIHETFALLDQVDKRKTVPVVATHAGYRFGDQDYMLSCESIKKIKERKGVVGLIMAQHQLAGGLWGKTYSLADSVKVVHAHIRRIREITGSHEYVALGTDFDGFIKPTLTGLGDMAELPMLQMSLVDRYGRANARRIASENAVNVLKRLWRV